MLTYTERIYVKLNLDRGVLVQRCNGAGSVTQWHQIRPASRAHQIRSGNLSRLRFAFRPSLLRSSLQLRKKTRLHPRPSTPLQLLEWYASSPAAGCSSHE